jgi:general secretion pathway protein A
VPRRINLLADRALLGAYAQGRQRADRRTVDQAALEVFGQRPQPAGLPRWMLVFAGTLALGAGLGWGLTAWWSSGPSAAAANSASMPAKPVATSAAAAATKTPLAATEARWGPAPAASVSGVAGSVADSQRASALAAGASGMPPDARPGAMTAPSSPVPLNDPAPLLAAAQSSPATAWRELALQWHVAVGEGEPCAAVAQAQLACLRSAAGGLPVVRQLARPGLLALRGGDGQTVYAQLLALGERSATLQAGNQRFELTLPALARVWRGEFATLWRTPPGWRADGGPQGDAAQRVWVAAQLAAAGQGGAAPLPDRVRAFQVAQGLPPDGVAGPMTLIALIRLTATGPADEPRLGMTR